MFFFKSRQQAGKHPYLIANTSRLGIRSGLLQKKYVALAFSPPASPQVHTPGVRYRQMKVKFWISAVVTVGAIATGWTLFSQNKRTTELDSPQSVTFRIDRKSVV